MTTRMSNRYFRRPKAEGAPCYPDTFTDDVDAITYFIAHFGYYNNVRLHGIIGYVTPAQRHCGEDKEFIAVREMKLQMARAPRLKDE